MRTHEGHAPHGPQLADLLDATATFIRRFVVLTPEQADAISLWVAHTYAVDAAETTPYLNISSPEKASGKTRLLETLELLVARPWLTGRLTAAVLARKINDEHPTLLLDETDAAFASGDEFAEVLRGVLNTGYRRSGKTSICTGKGANITYVDLSTFCPKAFAGLKRLPDTVEDRAISIRLKRRASNEPVQRFRRRDAEADAASLRQQVNDWCGEAVPILRDARPDIPEGLSDRAGECWEPLFAIADHAGGPWPERARHAAVVLFGAGADARESCGVLLLRALAAIYDERGTDRLTTPDLLKALVDREDEPWGEWWGKAVAAGDPRGPGYRLAKMLKEFGVRPRKIRNGRDVRNGYLRADLEDAFNRYLPSPPRKRQNEVTTQTGRAFAAFPRFLGRETTERPKPLSGLDCNLVPSFGPPGEGTGEREADLALPDGQLRRDVLALAKCLGWPEVQARPGERVVGDEAHWKTFVTTNPTDCLQTAYETLAHQARVAGFRVLRCEAAGRRVPVPPASTMRTWKITSSPEQVRQAVQAFQTHKIVDEILAEVRHA